MDQPRQWTERELHEVIDARVKARRFSANDIGTFISAIGAVLAALLTIWTTNKVSEGNHKISRVEDRQAQHQQTTQDVKTAVEAEKSETGKKLDRIEKQTAAVESKIQLVGTKASPK